MVTLRLDKKRSYKRGVRAKSVHVVPKTYTEFLTLHSTYYNILYIIHYIISIIHITYIMKPTYIKKTRFIYWRKLFSSFGYQRHQMPRKYVNKRPWKTSVIHEKTKFRITSNHACNRFCISLRLLTWYAQKHICLLLRSLPLFKEWSPNMELVFGQNPQVFLHVICKYCIESRSLHSDISSAQLPNVSTQTSFDCVLSVKLMI